MTPTLELTTRESSPPEPQEFPRGLGLFDSIMVVVGAMIGSGIFIVPAEMARHIGSAGWLLVAWAVAGALTIAGALCYGAVLLKSRLGYDDALDAFGVHGIGGEIGRASCRERVSLTV